MAGFLWWLYHHSLSVALYRSQESWVLVSTTTVQSVTCVNNLGVLWREGRIHLLAHYTISWFPLCRVIWKHGTYKMLVRYILSSICLRLSLFSRLSVMQYMGLCVFTLSISLLIIVRIIELHLIIIKSEVWITSFCFGLGHETMVCFVCLVML